MSFIVRTLPASATRSTFSTATIWPWRRVQIGFTTQSIQLWNKEWWEMTTLKWKFSAAKQKNTSRKHTQSWRSTEYSSLKTDLTTLWIEAGLSTLMAKSQLMNKHWKRWTSPRGNWSSKLDSKVALSATIYEERSWRNFQVQLIDHIMIPILTHSLPMYFL